MRREESSANPDKAEGHDDANANPGSGASGPGDELLATAEPRHIGRRTQVWVVDIHRRERQLAMFTLTQFVIAPDG